MKYAMRFYNGCPVINEVDEILIKYDARDVELFNFIDNHQNQRVIVHALTAEAITSSLDIFSALVEHGANFVVLLNSIMDFSCLKENNIPFFFEDRVVSLTQLETYITNGVTDVYIAEDLGFNIIDVSQLCHSNQVSVRVFPNVAQSPVENPVHSETCFFIRPEAVDLYEQYVDVLEFYGTVDKQEVLYKIYKDQYWLGDLSLLILDLKAPIYNDGLMPYFDVIRLNCKKQCVFSKCNNCKLSASLAETFRSNNYYVDKEVKSEYKTIKTIMQNENEDTIRYDEEVSKESWV